MHCTPCAIHVRFSSLKPIGKLFLGSIYLDLNKKKSKYQFFWSTFSQKNRNSYLKLAKSVRSSFQKGPKNSFPVCQKACKSLMRIGHSGKKKLCHSIQNGQIIQEKKNQLNRTIKIEVLSYLIRNWCAFLFKFGIKLKKTVKNACKFLILNFLHIKKLFSLNFRVSRAVDL